jgi:hypothetical protein
VIACSFKSPASFGELFERHATTMFRYFVRRVGPDDADSLLGERRTTVVPLDSGSAFEFAERLEFLEIGCDDPYLEVAALVCNCPRYFAHILSVDRPSRPVQDANSVEELILVDHHAPAR